MSIPAIALLTAGGGIYLALAACWGYPISLLLISGDREPRAREYALAVLVAPLWLPAGIALTLYLVGASLLPRSLTK